jgi:phosphatidate cytidylyltransferase
MSEFLKRSITGFLLVVVMISSIFSHPISALILFFLIAFFTLNEFYGLMRNFTPFANKYLHSLAGAYLVVVSFISAMSLFSKWLLLPYFTYLIFLYFSELYKKNGASILNIGCAILGHSYIALPFALIGWFGYLHNTNYQPILLLALFIFIWMNDSGAYLIGSQIGKHSLFERISPKKSWEGFVGGLAFAVGVSQIIAHYFDVLAPIQWVGFAIVTSISATFGDLFESFFKRSIGIKDSGNILPGHGGMLDRFDAPLFAIPATMIYLYFFC